MSWYDAIKAAGDAAEKLHDAELNQRLALVVMEGAKLAEENAKLRDELTQLREASRLREVLVFRDDVYWLDGTESEPDGPYCQRCWDGARKIVRLTDGGRDRWFCTVCNLQPWKPGGRERFRSGGRGVSPAPSRTPWRR